LQITDLAQFEVFNAIYEQQFAGVKPVDDRPGRPGRGNARRGDGDRQMQCLTSAATLGYSWLEQRLTRLAAPAQHSSCRNAGKSAKSLQTPT
jgi:hypothetical protein